MLSEEIGSEDRCLLGELDLLQTHITGVLQKNRALQEDNQTLQDQLQSMQAENIALRHKLGLVASRVEYIIANIPSERLTHDVTA